jgi:Tetrapyrrole (Corrin/Porphyrin) Methylases
MKRRGGSLAAVGIGIRSPAQATFEVASRIQTADKVFCLVADPIAEYWIRTLNVNTESLAGLYAIGKVRNETYREIVERITTAVKEGLGVCAVSYGHPGVAAFPFHEAVRLARAEGFPAEMLAGVSAEDCLFADLGIDPVDGGCLSYEATDFLLRRRLIDPASNLILWQIGVIAEPGYKQKAEAWNRDGLVVLAERLLEVYAAEHEAVVYETATILPSGATIERVQVSRLYEARVTPMSTLFVPPMRKAPIDEAMMKRLQINTL